MSKYTTQVRFICETYAGLEESADYPSVGEIIESAREHIFDFNFPIFDEEYRKVLETKILKHFYTREIGFETIALWKLKLDVKLNEIMPYYNQLYKSELLEFNPLYDVNVTRKHDTDIASGSKSSSNTSTSSNTKALYSDTPQGSISNLEDNTYLTNATIGNGTEQGETKGTSEGTTTEEYLETVVGKQGTTAYSDLLQKYRETFLNIDMQVIKELNNLFMLVW